jgi:hypothetical protein
MVIMSPYQATLNHVANIIGSYATISARHSGIEDLCKSLMAGNELVHSIHLVFNVYRFVTQLVALIILSFTFAKDTHQKIKAGELKPLP